KYHNFIKENILHKCKGNLGSRNGGDLYRWKIFHKVVCVEPDRKKKKFERTYLKVKN
ncbi:hypothetical protein H8356DRAFT_933277, partial [Neocallimastix lanati (nom. inval.)]